MHSYPTSVADLAVARLMGASRPLSGTVESDAQLAVWLREHLAVHLPTRACSPQHTPPFRAFADAYFARHPLTVWHASRGFGGKSYMLAALGLAEACTLGAEVRVLGGSADQSENVVRYTDGWTARSTIAALLSDRAGGREAGVTRSRIRLRGGGMVDALAASSRAVRGPHPTRLRVDECDELDVKILDAALGQTMARGGIAAQTVISSTHHYPDGTMAEVLRRALDRGWPVYRWCYRCTMMDDANPGGWLDPDEVHRKRGEVPSAMWSAEYDLQEPQPESRAFETGAVEAMFDASLGTFDGRPGELVVLEEPQEGAWYATGADWAKERDWTVIATLRCDVEPVRLVAYERIARLPWPTMVARFDDRVAKYEGVAAFDATGIGNVVTDLMTVGALPVLLVGRQRSELLTRYLVAVEGGRIKPPRIDHPYGEHRYAAVDDLFGSGHLPDSVCAMALAWLGAASRLEVQWL
jgi:hypothetical protein